MPCRPTYTSLSPIYTPCSVAHLSCIPTYMLYGIYIYIYIYIYICHLVWHICPLVLYKCLVGVHTYPVVLHVYIYPVLSRIFPVFLHICPVFLHIWYVILKAVKTVKLMMFIPFNKNQSLYATPVYLCTFHHIPSCSVPAASIDASFSTKMGQSIFWILILCFRAS